MLGNIVGWGGRRRFGAAAIVLCVLLSVLLLAPYAGARGASEAPLSAPALSNPAAPNATASQDVPYDPEWVSGGLFHMCALRLNGAIDCWGDDSEGQDADRDGPFKQVAAGGSHSCGLRTNGNVECWGENGSGQGENYHGPFTQITAGPFHNCGVRPDGSVDCWGDNGTGEGADQDGPFVQVTAGLNHTCGLRPDHSVFCWGSDSDGQLQVPEGDFYQISAGWLHTCGLLTNGHVMCWGLNDFGQSSPVAAGPFVQVAAEGWFSCGLKPDGSVACWGENNEGQSNSPSGHYRQITGGGTNACGLRRYGAIDCWGNDDYGQGGVHAGPYGQIIGDPVAAHDEYRTGIGEPLFVGPAGVLANDTNALGDARVYFIDGEGHINEAVWFSNWWRSWDITDFIAMPSPIPGSVLTPLTISGHPRVFYLSLGDNGIHINELAWWDGTFYHTDLTATTNAKVCSQQAYAAQQCGAVAAMDNGGEARVYYLDSEQHINEIGWSGGTWFTSDVTLAANATPAIPGSALGATTTANGDPAVYYIGGTGYNLHELAWYQDGWLHWNVSGDNVNAPPAATNSPIVAINYYNQPCVYYVDVYNEVGEYCWDSSQWKYKNLMSLSGHATAPYNRELRVLVALNRAPRVYYLSQAGHVQELVYASDSQWNGADLTALIGSPPAIANGAMVVSTAALDPRVFYQTANNRIQELALVGQGWFTSDITDRSAGVPVAAGSKMAATTANVDLLTADLEFDVHHGTLELNADGSFLYTPDPGYEGKDTFTYWTNNAWSQSNDSAAVDITVGPPLVALNVVVQLYHNPTPEQRAIYENIIAHFADGVYESSNGSRKLALVTFRLPSQAPIFHIKWIETCHPSAYVGSYTESGRFYGVNMCDRFVTSDGDEIVNFMSSDYGQIDGGYVLAHEWGHYYLGLYDEYPLVDGDVAVENSIMANPHRAAQGAGLDWLNFSTRKNFNDLNEQARVYGVSGWETLIRPATEDPQGAWQFGSPYRTAYRDFQRVAPPLDQLPAFELPGTGRSELTFIWATDAFAADTAMPATEPALVAQIASLEGNILTYPNPMLLTASVQRELPLAGLGVAGSVRLPDGTTAPLTFTDNGQPPDALAGDGIYTALYNYTTNGDYQVRVTFDNHAGKAAFVGYAFQPAAGPNGEYIPLPGPVPYPTDFSLPATLDLTVANVAADDHGNTPATSRSIMPNNEQAAGRIDAAGDKDVFHFTTLPQGPTYVRVTNLGLGMNPRLRILAANGTTVLAEARRFGAQYPFVVLTGLPANTPVYAEVTHVVNTANGGIYALSAGGPLASDEPLRALFLSFVSR